MVIAKIIRDLKIDSSSQSRWSWHDQEPHNEHAKKHKLKGYGQRYENSCFGCIPEYVL